ncbi:MAG: hypothetical protein LBC07_04590 [Elusimicrobiota bacterium]|nr:hypothetical protein [Elusimicrobiota bacterium]
MEKRETEKLTALKTLSSLWKRKPEISFSKRNKKQRLKLTSPFGKESQKFLLPKNKNF